MGIKSYSREKRDKFPYRDRYIKHNRGLFGKLYFCSLCYTPLSRTDMVVDHILPISKWYGINRTFNCVAICQSCNSKKGDRITFALFLRGLLAKILEEIYIWVQRALQGIACLIAIAVVALVRMCLTPFKTNRSLLQKSVIAITYCYILALII